MHISQTNVVIPDFILLNLDLNGTVTFADTTKNVNEIIYEVAGAIFSCWNGSARMSYKDYIQKVRFPGNKYQKDIKEKQEEEIGKFLLYLEEKASTSAERAKLYHEASVLYRKLAEKYLHPATERAVFTPFDSVFKLIQTIEKRCLYTCIIRTFGNDGPLIAAAFKEKGITLDRTAIFSSAGMQLSDQTTVLNGEKLLESILETNRLGKDHVQEWFNNDRKAESGKRIYCVSDSHFKGRTIISIIFDDNLKKIKNDLPADPQEQNIAFPIDVYGRPVSWNAKGIIGIRVNPIKAALDENYFVKKVNKALSKRGFTTI
jgi:hypothetical protein